MAHITVVDDIAVNREFLVALLTPFGHRVTEAADGASALKLVLDEQPDLMICDILMPQMDGYELVRCLRADPRIAATPVIFCSAHFLEQEAQQLAELCGVSKVVTKPVDPQDMIDVVDSVLAQSGGGSEPRLPLRGREFDREHLRLVTDKLSEKVAELQGTNDKLASLIELNLQLASERDKERLLDHVCRGACALIGAEHGAVAVRRTDGSVLAHLNHCGIDAASVPSMDTWQLDAGALGRVYRDGVVVRLALSQDGIMSLGLPAGYPVARNLLAAPIKSLSANYGWICLLDKAGVDGFSTDDAELLGILAAEAGRIYENGSLYATLKDYANELEAEIDERKRTRGHLAALYGVAKILNAASRLEDAAEKLLGVACLELGFCAATLWRVDEAEGTLQCVEVWSRSAEGGAGFLDQIRSLSLTSDMGRAGDASPKDTLLWLDDLRGSSDALRRQAAEQLRIGSGGAVAIMVGGRLIGALEVFRPERGALDGALAATLAALAGQIGAFFERMAQQQRIVRLTRLYAVLSSINSAIVRIHDSRLLFQEACRVAVHEGGLAMAWIGEVGSEGEGIVPLARERLDDGIGPDRPEPDGDGVLGADAAWRAVHGARLVVVNAPADAEPDPDPTPLDLPRRTLAYRGYRSLAALPLTVQTKVVNVMVIYAHEPEFFTGEEQGLLNELANDISFALEFIANQDRLAYLVHHDELTGLPNRAHLLEHLCAALQAARHHPSDRVGVVVWDVSRFRNINDTFGRQVGDKVIRELARRLKGAWPETSDVSRIGVDQFAGVISGDYELSEIAHLIEDTGGRILDAPVVVGDHELRITVSAGIALGNGRDDVADTLISNAEAALRKAKDSGFRYRFYGPEMNALIAETLLRENRLRQALERDEFVLHYQPKICALSGEVTGLEALLRWNDPTDGLVYPGTFIPILEETGMIIQVGLWAIRTALADVRLWQAAGLDGLRVAVNVSALQLQHPGFVDSLRRVTDEFGDIARRLDLEITESMIMTDIEANVSHLAEVRRMGIEIAIDDFGTGYSSLSYLAKLPVHALKIDRSFVATMDTTPESMTIPTTIISLAHALGLRVTAEGVEEESQATSLRRFKCDELQGYLISRPLPFAQIEDFVRGRVS
ncbi:EAL domain-containing protein [Thiocapsa rosea]|uniref:cyclic-guanylate-specific phosphodiesterase n=1 Tax=Thiocapsa rosea TaxID=69360 RepID=A0A495VG98_9GAMM|nr:EAL domain-containing protein [Thiocapsa rosea]RKT46858.1 diguanylate cyclase (GGDEF)-like protein [Thiocapsa rosea]